MTSHHSSDELADRLSRAGNDRSLVEAVLAEVLEWLEGRAIGLWRATDRELEQLGFATVADMSRDVDSEFRTITTTVPLSETSLGIVKAVVSRQPTIARVHETTGDLQGSATWLDRFGCQSSLAVPIVRENQLVGVLAVSSRESFDETHGSGLKLVEIARRVELEPRD